FWRGGSHNMKNIIRYMEEMLMNWTPWRKDNGHRQSDSRDSSGTGAVPVSAATSVSSGAHAITRIARSVARAEARAEVAKEERTRSGVEIMGWRAWTLVPGEECLRSVTFNHVIGSALPYVVR